MKIDRKPTRRFDMAQKYTATLSHLVEKGAYNPQEALSNRGYMNRLTQRKPKCQNSHKF